MKSVYLADIWVSPVAGSVLAPWVVDLQGSYPVAMTQAGDTMDVIRVLQSNNISAITRSDFRFGMLLAFNKLAIHKNTPIGKCAHGPAFEKLSIFSLLLFLQ